MDALTNVCSDKFLQPPSEIKTPKAVMVFIHGGGFMTGSGSPNSYSPDYLINYDIVFATFNYRLHALGTLYVLKTERNKLGSQ